jgi:hypothetical protein
VQARPPHGAGNVDDEPPSRRRRAGRPSHAQRRAVCARRAAMQKARPAEDEQAREHERDRQSAPL